MRAVHRKSVAGPRLEAQAPALAQRAVLVSCLEARREARGEHRPVAEVRVELEEAAKRSRQESAATALTVSDPTRRGLEMRCAAQR